MAGLTRTSPAGRGDPNTRTRVSSRAHPYEEYHYAQQIWPHGPAWTVSRAWGMRFEAEQHDDEYVAGGDHPGSEERQLPRPQHLPAAGKPANPPGNGAWAREHTVYDPAPIRLRRDLTPVPGRPDRWQRHSCIGTNQRLSWRRGSAPDQGQIAEGPRLSRGPRLLTDWETGETGWESDLVPEWEAGCESG